VLHYLWPHRPRNTDWLPRSARSHRSPHQPLFGWQAAARALVWAAAARYLGGWVRPWGARWGLFKATWGPMLLLEQW